MAIARIAMTYPSKVLRGPNGSRGSSVMADGVLSCGLIARCQRRLTMIVIASNAL